MNKIEFESYLDKYVEVTLIDDFTYRGILSRTNDFLETGYYFLRGIDDNIIFRCLHVKKIKTL